MLWILKCYEFFLIIPTYFSMNFKKIDFENFVKSTKKDKRLKLFENFITLLLELFKNVKKIGKSKLSRQCAKIQLYS